MKKIKNPLTAACAAIDKKLERFDPKWQARHGAGGLRSRYQDKTGIARYREWRGVKDTFVDYTAWLNNLLSMGKMVVSAPIPVLKGFWEYRWMGSYLGTFMFIDRLFEGFRGYELVTAHKCMHAIVRSLTKKIAFCLSNDRRLGGGKDTVAQATRKDFDYALGKARMKLAATFLMGYPGMPTVYYGDEAGQYGSSDPDCRRTYPWGHEDQDLIAHYQKVISVRNSHKALFAHGDVNTLKAEGDIYAFARTAVDGSGQAAVVALNRGAAKAVELPAGQFADGTVFTDQISGAQATVSGGKLTLTLGENQSMMLLNA